MCKYVFNMYTDCLAPVCNCISAAASLCPSEGCKICQQGGEGGIICICGLKGRVAPQWNAAWKYECGLWAVEEFRCFCSCWWQQSCSKKMSPKLAVNLGLDLSEKMWFFIFLMIGNLPLDCLHKESLWRQEKLNILGDACRGQEERKNEDQEKIPLL